MVGGGELPIVMYESYQCSSLSHLERETAICRTRGQSHCRKTPWPLPEEDIWEDEAVRSVSE